MSIDKISPAHPSQHMTRGQKTSKASPINAGDQKKDAFALTQESQNKIAFKKALAIVNKTPDVRADVVANAKANLESLTRPSEDVLDKVAERLFAEFGLKNS